MSAFYLNRSAFFLNRPAFFLTQGSRFFKENVRVLVSPPENTGRFQTLFLKKVTFSNFENFCLALGQVKINVSQTFHKQKTADPLFEQNADFFKSPLFLNKSAFFLNTGSAFWCQKILDYQKLLNSKKNFYSPEKRRKE